MTVQRSSLCIALGLSLLGCEVSEPGQPKGSSVEVRVRDPQGLASGQAVRAAVVWVSGARAADAAGGPGTLQTEVTADQAFAIDPARNEAQITLPLGLPSWRAQERLYPVETLALIVTEEIRESDVVLIYRPRIVVYADRDADGRLDVAGGDLVLAADGADSASVAAVLELPEALADLSLDSTDAFYRATGSRYTPFLRVTPFSRLASGRGVYEVGSDRPLQLVLGRSPIAGADVHCGRGYSAFLNSDLQFSLPTTSDERTILVDVTIDASSLCASAESSCDAAALAAIEPPEIQPRPDQDGSLRAYCRVWNGFEALWVIETEVTCDGCECGIRRVTRAYVVQSQAPPPWWPCGSTLPFCDTDAPALAPADC